MPLTYYKYYQTENLFGQPFPELIEFLYNYGNRGNLLDLGCGQGRDAIALARLGFTVTGIDTSKVGIAQMNEIGAAEKLNLVGRVEDMYSFSKFDEFDFILLDSMLHFANKEKEREKGLIQNIVSSIKNGCLLIVCIQDTGRKVQILHQAINIGNELTRLTDQKFKYTYQDEKNGHKSVSDYRMIVFQK